MFAQIVVKDAFLEEKSALTSKFTRQLLFCEAKIFVCFLVLIQRFEKILRTDVDTIPLTPMEVFLLLLT